jgi:hypothetical protein
MTHSPQLARNPGAGPTSGGRAATYNPGLGPASVL